MSPAPDIDRAFRQVLVARCPSVAAFHLADEVPLGEGGLGLDSIALADLLLGCGERFGIEPPVSLLAEEGLTIGQVIDHLRRTLA